MKLAICAAAAAAAIALAACGTSTPVSVKGSFQDCRGTDSAPTQVTVENSAHTVIGTADLKPGHVTAVDLLGSTLTEVDYSFRLSLPQEARYGFTVDGVQGTIWLTPKEIAHAGISAGC